MLRAGNSIAGAAAQGEEMSGAKRRTSNWTPDEDRRLLELIKAGKSWVFISANLKRPVKSIRDRVSQMRRSRLKAKGK